MTSEFKPLSPIFRKEIAAAPSDIDELGHVSNIAYIRWVQEVATLHSAAVGLSREEYERIGAIWVISRHEIDYLESAMEGDRIALVTFIATWRAASSERHTRIERVADGTVLAQARTLWAYVRRASGRPTRIPREVAYAFGIFPRPEAHSQA
jgi:acyl-CoA thioester hydrolase